MGRGRSIPLTGAGWPGFLLATTLPLSLSSQWHLLASPESSPLPRNPSTHRRSPEARRLPGPLPARDRLLNRAALPRDSAPRPAPPTPPGFSRRSRRQPHRCCRGALGTPGQPVGRARNFPGDFPSRLQRGPRTRKLRGWGLEATSCWNPLGAKSGCGRGSSPEKPLIVPRSASPRGQMPGAWAGGLFPHRPRSPRAAVRTAWGGPGPAERLPPRSAGCGLVIIYELQPLFAQLMMHRRPRCLASLARRRGQGSACNWKPEPSPPGHFPFTPRCLIEGCGVALLVP